MVLPQGDRSGEAERRTPDEYAGESKQSLCLSNSAALSMVNIPSLLTHKHEEPQSF